MDRKIPGNTQERTKREYERTQMKEQNETKKSQPINRDDR